MINNDYATPEQFLLFIDGLYFSIIVVYVDLNYVIFGSYLYVNMHYYEIIDLYSSILKYLI